MNTQEFIEKAREIHGDRYDYSKVEYVSTHTKVCIICPEHGEFWQAPANHLRGHGCPKCAHEDLSVKQRLSLDDFLKRAREIHCDRYDYSKIEYINATTKVCIICPEHGEFWQTPSKHLIGRGCPTCSGHFKRTTEWFIEKAREVHGDRYDYSKVDYINTETKVCIICQEHGEFWQIPYSHLSGCGCPKCVGRIMTTQECIEKAREIHGDRYDYSKVEYVSIKTKVCIICPEHGEYWQTPETHLIGRGCPKCGVLQKIKALSSTTEEFIKKAREVHGDRYDYSKVEYVNCNTKVCIICPEHGEFWQTPSDHINGKHGCPKCAGRNLSTEDFVAKAREVHGDRYDYSKVVYKKAMEDVCIICPEHGEFWQRASHHLKGVGCPNCQGLRKQYKFNLLQEFESEYEFRAFLENNDVNILFVILRNLEPKFEPIKADIERALRNIEFKDPIQALEEKYTKDDEEDTEETSTDTKEEEVAPVDITYVDLDDDDAVSDVIGTKETEEEEGSNPKPTIEDVVKNREKELEAISKIEHMLTPEDREYIMEKFLNDKMRVWMSNRETSSN